MVLYVDVLMLKQVYHPLGIESSAVNNLHPDPNCIVCHSSGKDAYLLLCELCSSSCHTYCVGLGADIPEGEWFCPDCAIAKNKYLKTQPDDECPFEDQETKEKIRKIRQGGSSISLSDFVADLSEDGTMNSVTYSIRRDARPLSCSLRRMEHVRRLRENWDRLRSSELQFSSEVLRPNYISEDDGKGNINTATSSELTTEQSSREADASKAWRMMDMAKSACSDRLPKNASQSCPKFMASKQIQKEKKGKGLGAIARRLNTAADLYYNGHYNLSKEVSAQGKCNKLVQQLRPMRDELYVQVKPESNRESQTGSRHRVPECGFSDLGKRKEIEMGPHLQVSKIFSTSDRRDADKDEIQSLVKLSLKALDKDKKLGIASSHFPDFKALKTLVKFSSELFFVFHRS
jgi:PHD-finger